MLANTGLNPNGNVAIQNRFTPTRFDISSSINAQNAAVRRDLSQDSIFRDRRDQFQEQVKLMDAQFKQSLSPDFLDTANASELKMFQELQTLKNSLAQETLGIAVNPGSFSEKSRKIQGLSSQLNQFYSRPDVIRYTQANAFYKKANELATITSKDDPGIVNRGLYDDFVDDLTEFKGSGDDLAYQKLVKSYANLMGNYRMDQKEVDTVIGEIKEVANNQATLQDLALRYSGTGLAKLAKAGDPDAIVKVMVNAAEKDSRWRTVVEDAWAKNAEDGQSYEDYAREYMEIQLGLGLPNTAIQNNAVQLASTDVLKTRETEEQRVRGDDRLANDQELAGTEFLAKSALSQQQFEQDKILQEEQTKRALITKGGTGTGTSANVLGGYLVPEDVMNKIKKGNVPVDIVPELAEVITNATSTEDAIKQIQESDRLNTYLTEDNTIPSVVTDYINTRRPVPAGTPDTATTSAPPRAINLTVEGAPEFNLIEGFSVAESNVLNAESSGGKFVVNADDEGLPSVGAHQFRGKRGQQFLAEFYPEMARKYDLTEGPLSPEVAKQLETELLAKPDQLQNSSIFYRREFAGKMQQKFKDVFDTEDVPNQANVILESMSVNIDKGQDFILREAKKLVDSEGLEVHEALNQVRVDYVKGNYREKENKGKPFVKSQKTLINLLGRYDKEIKIARNEEKFRNAASDTPKDTETSEVLSDYGGVWGLPKPTGAPATASSISPTASNPAPTFDNQITEQEAVLKGIPETDEFGRSNKALIDQQTQVVDNLKTQKTRQEELVQREAERDTNIASLINDLEPAKPTTVYGNVSVTKSTTEPPTYLVKDNGASILTEAGKGLIMHEDELIAYLKTSQRFLNESTADE